MKLDKLRKDILNVIENANLDIDCVYFVLQDIINNVSAQYLEKIEAEQKEENQEHEPQEDASTMLMKMMGAVAAGQVPELPNMEPTVPEAEEINKTEEE